MCPFQPCNLYTSAPTKPTSCDRLSLGRYLLTYLYSLVFLRFFFTKSQSYSYALRFITKATAILVLFGAANNLPFSKTQFLRMCRCVLPSLFFPSTSGQYTQYITYKCIASTMIIIIAIARWNWRYNKCYQVAKFLLLWKWIAAGLQINIRTCVTANWGRRY